MTKQEAYEHIREFFSRPGAQLAVDRHSGNCVYRGNGDPASPIRCAVGCLIPDVYYSPSIEDTNVTTLDLDYYGIGADLAGFLSDAQKAHDASGGIDFFLRRLDIVAALYGLEVGGAAVG